MNLHLVTAETSAEATENESIPSPSDDRIQLGKPEEETSSLPAKKRGISFSDWLQSSLSF